MQYLGDQKRATTIRRRRHSLTPSERILKAVVTKVVNMSSSRRDVLHTFFLVTTDAQRNAHSRGDAHSVEIYGILQQNIFILSAWGSFTSRKTRARKRKSCGFKKIRNAKQAPTGARQQTAAAVHAGNQGGTSGTVYQILMAGQLAFYGLAAAAGASLWVRATRLGGIAFYFTISHIAMAIGICTGLFNLQRVTWTRTERTAETTEVTS